jgi:ribosomal protein S18 acetylase RimI-like enzyme
MTQFSLRVATDDDFELMREAKLEGLEPYVAELWGWDRHDQERRFCDQFEPEREQIISNGGRAVGWLSVAEVGGAVELSGIYVLAEFRSHGIGEAVVRDVVERATAKGQPVRLQVLRPNPARRLYGRIGFAVSGETSTHFQMQYPAQYRE